MGPGGGENIESFEKLKIPVAVIMDSQNKGIKSYIVVLTFRPFNVLLDIILKIYRALICTKI